MGDALSGRMNRPDQKGDHGYEKADRLDPAPYVWLAECEPKSGWAEAGRKRARIEMRGTPMSIAEEWEQLKSELQRDADRLIARATGTVIHDRIEADLTEILRISEPTNDHELPPVAKSSSCYEPSGESP